MESSAVAVVNSSVVVEDFNPKQQQPNRLKEVKPPTTIVVTATSVPPTNDSFERVDSMMVEDDDDKRIPTKYGKPSIPTNATTAVAAAAATPPPTSLSPSLPSPAAIAGAGKDPQGVRVVQLHEWKAAALSLAEAFARDDSSRYFLDTPDRAHWSEAQKWEVHLRIMEYLTYAHLLKGLVVTAGPNMDCVALWLPPGHEMDDFLTMLRSGMWRLHYLLCPEGRKRFFTEFLPLLHDTKRQVLGPDVDADSWYLVYIGTRPAGRGKGYARKVIESVTKGRADGDGKVCYLESTHPDNRAIYQRLGFGLKKNVYLQRGERHVEMDIMVREPGAGVQV